MPSSFSLASGNYFQDWSNMGALTTDDTWPTDSAIIGYLGDVSSSTSANAVSSTSTAAALGAIDLIANQTNVNISNGGVAEFQITDPVVALQGSGTADIPSLVLYLDATGRSDLHLALDLRDIDSSGDNSPQAFNIQYRVGDTADWTNLPDALIADASVGPNLTNTTHLEFDLPAVLNGQGQVEIRFLTVNATGSDEWLGIDNISVTSVAGGAADAVAPTLSTTSPVDDGTNIAIDGNIVLNFSEPVRAGTGDIVITDGNGDTRTIAIGDASQVVISGARVTINPSANLSPGDTYHLSIADGVLLDAANNAYAGTGANPIDFTTSNPLVTLAIGAIQGEGHRSAFVGQIVMTQGVVTAIDTNGGRGFYLQDPNGDGNARTSDAVFIFTNAAVTVHVGDSLQITGTVTEFQGSSTNNLTTTEITAPTITTLTESLGTVQATVIGQGGVVPPTSIIDNDNFATFDPQQDGIDFYETLEAMLVTVQDARAVAATRNGATFIVADGGVGATGINDRGGITVTDGDYNPERIDVFADSGLFPDFRPAYAQGSQLGDVTGVIGYFGGNYELLATSVGNSAPGIALADETTALRGDASHLSFAEYNVENLDPSDTKFGDLGQDIAVNLGSPDVIALAEIQDADGAGNGTDLTGTATLQRLVDAIITAGGPRYSFVEIAPTVTNTNGGEPNGNIRNAFLYNADRVRYVAGSATQVIDTDPANGDAFRNSRRPLVAQFEFNDETVTTVAVHNFARTGSDQLFGNNQPPINSGDQVRNDQTAALHSYSAQLQGIDPAAKIAVAGDFNGFYFEQSLANVTAGGSLNNLSDLLPLAERYTSQFEGNSEQIDHILASASLTTNAQFDVVHLNTGQPGVVVSDHDPIVALFEIPDTLNGLATSAQVVRTSDPAANRFIATAGPDAFYFSGVTGNDTIIGFGSNDVIITDVKILDSNNDGVVTWSTRRGGVHIDGTTTGDQITLPGYNSQAGLRYLGESDGRFVYEAANDRPNGAIESLVSDDALAGRTGQADRFFFNTAIGLDLGDDIIANFGTTDKLLTTSQLAVDSSGNVIFSGTTLGLPNAGGNAAGHPGGTVSLFDESGAALTSLHLAGIETAQGLTYYTYAYGDLPG